MMIKIIKNSVLPVHSAICISLIQSCDFKLVQNGEVLLHQRQQQSAKHPIKVFRVLQSKLQADIFLVW